MTRDRLHAALSAAAAAATLALARPVRVVRPLAASAALCALAVFVAPTDFAGSYEASGRYALAAWTFGLFAFDGRAPSRRALAVPLGLALAAFGHRHALLARAWVALGRDLDAQTALLDQLRRGATLANVTFLDPRAPRSARLRELALLHAPAMAVVRRDAELPTLYAIPSVQTIAHVRPRYDAHRFHRGEAGTVDVSRVRDKFDAVWSCRAPEAVREAITAGAEKVGEVAGCELWIDRAAAPQ